MNGFICFLTGMSGAGKSTAIAELNKRGYRAVDLDEPHWSFYDEHRDWIWREDLVEQLLADASDEPLFVSGCPTNQVKFYPQFDEIVLLSAPSEILLERLRTRATNAYGKSKEEQADVLHYVKTVEPRLRQVSTFEIDTRASVSEVIDRLLEFCDEG